MTRSHWRFAAGAALLSLGMMANGSAVAVADSDPGTPHGSDGGADSSSHSTTHGGGPAGSVSRTIKGVVNALAPEHRSRPPSSPGSTGPRMMSDGIRGHTPITGLSGPRQNTTPPTDDPITASPAVADPDSGLAQNEPGTAASDHSPLAPVTATLTSTATQVVQATNTLVAPATAAVQSLVAPVAAIPSMVVPVATELATNLMAPVPDVLTSIESMLTSATGAVGPITQLPTDLASMFGAAGVRPTGGHPGTVAPSRLPAAPAGPAPSVGQPTSEFGAVGTDDAARQVTPTYGVTKAISEAASVNASARATPGDSTSEGLQAFFHSYGAFVIVASLSALVAAALPGLLAFLVPTAAGIGLGYRQARAGLAVRASGIARFAGSGPVGIVRSGSFVAIRSTTRRPPALRIARSAPADVGNSRLAA